METLSTLRVDAPVRIPTNSDPEQQLTSQMLLQLFDYIDYPILICSPNADLAWCNSQGKTALEKGEHLCLRNKQILPACDSSLRQWQSVLSNATGGEESLIFLDDGLRSRAVSVAPLHSPTSLSHSTDDVLARHLVLIMGKRQVCRPLSLRRFSSRFKLTPAEQRVMAQLIAGLAPAKIATTHSVSEATVRSQIKSILAKTGIASIRNLILSLALLPPVHMARPE